MEVGPGCTCIVIIVERLVSEPSDRAALRRRRAPCLRTGGPGCTCVIIIEPLVSEPAGQAAASSSSSSASSQNRWAGLCLCHRRRAPRLGAGGPGYAASSSLLSTSSQSRRAGLRLHRRCRSPRLGASGLSCACVVVVRSPGEVPATAPMLIATLPTTASSSPTLAAAATDLLPPCRSSR
uniref:Uncharacterized protein n=1 Tax=Oryza rufipogon TaxID=4529 RepID=A0A0E0R8P6_ORYRU